MYTKQQLRYANTKNAWDTPEEWMSEYVYNVVMLAKKEPKNKEMEKK